MRLSDHARQMEAENARLRAERTEWADRARHWQGALTHAEDLIKREYTYYAHKVEAADKAGDINAMQRHEASRVALMDALTHIVDARAGVKHE